MNQYIVILFSTLLIFLTSCATTKREYPTSSYQCQKTGEIFEISNSIDEGNLICPDKTCGGKLVKVASYRRYGSGLNTRYGYSDPWRVGYSGPYVNRRSFFGMGFHSGHHHHHYYHDDKRSKSGSKKSSGPFSKNIPTSSRIEVHLPPPGLPRMRQPMTPFGRCLRWSRLRSGKKENTMPVGPVSVGRQTSAAAALPQLKR